MKITSESIVYCDANFLVVLAVEGKNDEQPEIKKAARILFAKLLIRGCKIIASPLTFDETWLGIKRELDKYKLQSKSAVSKIKRFIERKFSIKFKTAENAGFSYYNIFSELNSFTENLLQYKNFSVIQFNDIETGIKGALKNIKDFNFKPRDSFHFAYIQNNSASHLVTNDRHYGNKNLGIEVVNFKSL